LHGAQMMKKMLLHCCGSNDKKCKQLSLEEKRLDIVFRNHC
jgi:hypothetical protein